MKYLLDTCVLSELIKPKPNKKVIEWLADCEEESLFISVLTIGEIQKGISKLKDSKRHQKIQHWLDKDLIERFSGRILEINQEVALSWGIIEAKAQSKGKPIPTIDSLLAATAITYNLTFVTRNIDDVKVSGANLLNPWD